MGVVNYILNQDELKDIIKEKVSSITFPLKLTDPERKISVDVVNIDDMNERVDEHKAFTLAITPRYQLGKTKLEQLRLKISNQVVNIHNADLYILGYSQQLIDNYTVINGQAAEWLAKEQAANTESSLFYKTLKTNISLHTTDPMSLTMIITEDCVIRSIEIIVSDFDSVGDMWTVNVINGSSIDVVLVDAVCVKVCPERREVVHKLKTGDILNLKYVSLNPANKTVYYNIEFFK